MTNNETSVTSEKINKPKKAVAKKVAVKKEITQENISNSKKQKGLINTD